MDRIIIIDDDEALQESFSIVLRSVSDYKVINTYSTCEEAMANFKKDWPSIVLMDLEMPGIGGIEGIKRIKAIKPTTDVIVITSYENVDLLIKAFSAGALGYITKNKGNFFLDLLAAIEEMKNGGAPMSTAIARKFILSFQKNQNSPLSARETSVLELLATGMSYSAIAEELFVSKATIRAHIRNIYEKLHVHKKSEAIAYATQHKLI